MKPMPRIELPLWGNIILATLVGIALVYCAISLWRATRRK